MKVDSSLIFERNKIIWSFTTLITFTGLLATDITDHRHNIKQVYRQLLHEKSVYEECMRRFRRTFTLLN